MLEQALSYAARGWPVFPLAAGGKRPITPNGLRAATTDERMIERWWSRWPDANVGCVTGQAMGAWVLDLDGEAGAASLAQLEEQLGAPPETLAQRTGGGGRHLFFAWPEGAEVRNRTSLAPGVDVRGEGGYVVMPPSVHESGAAYEWSSEAAIAPAPKAWIDFVMPKAAATAKTVPPWERVDPARPRVAKSVPKTPVVERARLYLDEVEPAIQGAGGHNALLWAARALVVGFELDDATALELLWAHFNPRCLPPWDESDSGERKDFERKVGQARRTPGQKPQGWLLDEYGLSRGDDALLARGEAAAKRLLASAEVKAPSPPPPPEPEPEPEPEDLVPFRVPGFVSEVMDLTLETAPYPNEKLAFGGALALLAHLCGRKVRDLSDVRPNVYLLALAPSGSGKEHSRKINKLIALHAGLPDGIADSVASSQGLEDALLASPSLLFLLDEADALLRSISGAKDQRMIELQRSLLTLYSASSSTYRLRIRAGETSETIDQPHLTILGTAIPQHFFSALDERMLTNGLAGRMLVIDATGPRVGQKARVPEVPDRVIETARWWADFAPQANDLNAAHPRPALIPADEDAEALMRAFRHECDRRYARADRDAESERTIHARTCETARKLALLYAVSEGREEARITLAAAEWASAFARQQAAGVLRLIARHSAVDTFDSGCQRVLEAVRSSPGRRITRTELSKRIRTKPKVLNEWVGALIQREEIEAGQLQTTGRPATYYQLPGGKP